MTRKDQVEVLKRLIEMAPLICSHQPRMDRINPSVEGCKSALSYAIKAIQDRERMREALREAEIYIQQCYRSDSPLEKIKAALAEAGGKE